MVMPGMRSRSRLQERRLLATRGVAPHRLQHRVAGVLERDVQVLHHVREPRHRVDHAEVEGGGVGVHQPQPAAAVAGHRRVQRLQHPHQAGGLADVRAVARGVLADEVQLERTPASSDPASSTSAASGLERILPRIEGMVQKARWLQPSLTRR